MSNKYLLSDGKSLDSIKDEISVMKTLHHEGIVKLIEHGQDG